MLLYVTGHEMPKPCKVILVGNSKSIPFFGLVRPQKYTKIEKAIGILKSSVVMKCEQRFDSRTYCRWTKYSNPEEKTSMTLPSPNVNVKQRVCDMLGGFGRFDFICPPVSKDWKNTFLKFLGAVEG